MTSVKEFKLTREFKTRVKKLVALYLSIDIYAGYKEVESEQLHYSLVTNKKIKGLFPGVDLKTSEGWMEIMDRLQEMIDEIKLRQEAEEIVRKQTIMEMARKGIEKKEKEYAIIKTFLDENNLTIEQHNINTWYIYRKDKKGYEEHVGNLIRYSSQWKFIVYTQELDLGYRTVEQEIEKFKGYLGISTKQVA